MPSDGHRHVKAPEVKKAIGGFLSVPVYVQVDPGSKGINILGDPASRIKGFCIGQIIHQPYKIRGHFIGSAVILLLDFFPAVLISFYEQAFTQNG